MVISRVDVAILDHTPQLKRGLSRGALVYGKSGDARGKPVFVRLRSSDGVEGIAQLRPLNPWQGETSESMASAIRDYFAPILIGSDPFDRQRIYRKLEQALPNTHSALCVLDNALYDLLGKTLGVPIAVLLGGKRAASIPLEWSVGLSDHETMVAEAARAVGKYGVRTVCLKVGPRDHWQADVEVFMAVRDAIGPDIDLGIDANEGYNVSTAVRVAKRLTPHGLSYLEQPVPGWDLEGMAQVRARVDVPIMADESVFSAHDAYRVIRAEACDAIVLKLYKCGGITGSLQITTVAEAAGISVNVGGTAQGSQLEALAAMHTFAAVSNHIFGAEFMMGLADVEPDPVVPDVICPISDGSVTLPSGNGIGVDVDFERVKELALRTYSIE